MGGGCEIEHWQTEDHFVFPPSYPYGSYPNNCFYTFTKGEENRKVAIRVVNMDLEADFCNYDKLTIKTNGDDEHVLCGNVRGYTIYTEGLVVFQIKSDGSINGKGFEIFLEYYDDDTQRPFTDSIDVGDPCSSDVSSRIVGGQEAEEHSFPWIISLGFFGSHFCGGSIVDRTTIVTAAHCIHDITLLTGPEQNKVGLTVVVGEHT